MSWLNKFKNLQKQSTPHSDLKPNFVFTRDIASYRNYSIGVGTYGAPEVLDWHDGSKLIIGNYCSIAGVTIMLGGEHYINKPSTYPFESIELKTRNLDNTYVSDRRTKGDVIIGSDVWLGHKSTILSGVTIGDGAVIGACSVIAKDVPSYAIVVGNPSKIIRFRFDKSIIEAMLLIRWWDWPEDKIKQTMQDFKLPVEEFVEKHLNNY
jgi:chloramphenicol O-acetyltransferase type B